MQKTNPMHDPRYHSFVRRCRLILPTKVGEECAEEILKHLLERHELDGKASLKTDYSGRSIEFSIVINGEVLSGRLT